MGFFSITKNYNNYKAKKYLATSSAPGKATSVIGIQEVHRFRSKISNHYSLSIVAVGTQ